MKNENTRLRNRHTLYLAKSGHGKSGCLKLTAKIPSQGARCIFWDANKDHQAHRFNNWNQFVKAVRAGVQSGRGFRIAWAGEQGPDRFEQFCRVVNAVLDGDRLTYVVVEEYGMCCSSAGNLNAKMYPAHYQLWTQGRKYGAVIIATSQRPQTISKDALENAEIIWAGKMGKLAAKSVGETIDIDPARLQRDCQIGEFFHWVDSGGDAEKIRVFTPD